MIRTFATRYTLFLLLGASLIFFSETTVLAGSVSYTTSTPVPSTLTDWNEGLAFQQFDSSLGTLTSVEITTSFTIDTVLTIQNNSQSSSHGNAKTEVQLNLTDSGGNFGNLNPVIDVLSPNFSYSLASGGSVTSPTLTKTAGSDNIFTSNLSEFIGGSNIVLGASTFTQTDLSNTGGNTSAGQTTDASLTGMITYTYSAASLPEPSSAVLAVLGGFCGLTLIGMNRRRRRA